MPSTGSSQQEAEKEQATSLAHITLGTLPLPLPASATQKPPWCVASRAGDGLLPAAPAPRVDDHPCLGPSDSKRMRSPCVHVQTAQVPQNHHLTMDTDSSGAQPAASRFTIRIPRLTPRSHSARESRCDRSTSLIRGLADSIGARRV